LFERASRLGGRARLAAIVEPAIGELVAWLERQLVSLDIDVRLDTEAPPTVDADAVVLATGARLPTGDEQLAALLRGDEGGDVTIVGGNGPAALVAAMVAERGVHVTLASPHDTFGVGLSPPRLWRVMHALRSFGVTLTHDTKEPAGSFCLEPWEPDTTPFTFPDAEVHRVGDCNDVRLLDGAMLDAALVARAL
jgi:hypothetical protein